MLPFVTSSPNSFTSLAYSLSVNLTPGANSILGAVSFLGGEGAEEEGGLTTVGCMGGVITGVVGKVSFST